MSLLIGINTIVIDEVWEMKKSDHINQPSKKSETLKVGEASSKKKKRNVE